MGFNLMGLMSLYEEGNLDIGADMRGECRGETPRHRDTEARSRGQTVADRGQSDAHASQGASRITRNWKGQGRPLP